MVSIKAGKGTVVAPPGFTPKKGNGKNAIHYFVTAQLYATCGNTGCHLPNNCPGLPENKRKKEEYFVKKAAEAAAVVDGSN